MQNNGYPAILDVLASCQSETFYFRQECVTASQHHTVLFFLLSVTPDSPAALGHSLCLLYKKLTLCELSYELEIICYLFIFQGPPSSSVLQHAFYSADPELYPALWVSALP